jgi:hypothetical protein
MGVKWVKLRASHPMNDLFQHFIYCVCRYIYGLFVPQFESMCRAGQPCFVFWPIRVEGMEMKMS